ncbi:MAG: hypothetical protein WCP15_00105 [bacterium]
MKQVPEDKKVNSEQQLKILRNKLMGNQAFAFCRGKLGKQVVSVAADLIAETGTPTRFLSMWDEFFGKARVMTNLLAQFNRDGMNVAYEELLSALRTDTHFFPGETVPVEQTRPVTVLMLEPEKTVSFLSWLLEEHWMSLRDYLYWKDQKPGFFNKVPDKPSVLTERLYANFSKLEELARKHCSGYEGRELSEAYRQEIIDTFPEGALKNGKVAELGRPQWNDHIEHVGDIPFIYIFEMEQFEVLKMFSREDQKRIATWQFNLPKVITHFVIGLHPHKMHGCWKKSHPAFVSCGKSHGLAGVALVNSPLNSVAGSMPKYPVSYHSSGKSGKYGIIFEPCR